jgi:hypothetical protein
MHEEVLTKKATAIFPRLATFKDFYLAGGTSLALQIGHRVSVDFDMFEKNKTNLSRFNCHSYLQRTGSDEFTN